MPVQQTDKIKIAVKEALDDKRMEDLAKQMTDLSTQMTAGFTSVHTRQDTANGKLAKHDIAIENIKSKSLYEKITWLLITSLVGLVVFFLTRG